LQLLLLLIVFALCSGAHPSSLKTQYYNTEVSVLS
jgi:hypothetical protein